MVLRANPEISLGEYKGTVQGAAAEWSTNLSESLLFQETTSYVRVVPEDSYERAYDYAVPEALRGRISAGMKVRVPLRQSETTGIVIALMARSEFAKVRAVISIVGEREFIPGTLFRLAEWMADYYCAPLAAALRCVLPEPVRREMGALQRQWIEPRAGLSEEELTSTMSRAPKQREAWSHLRMSHGGWLAELENETGLGRAVWLGLVDKGLATLSFQSQEREPLWPEGIGGALTPPVLNEEQVTALQVWRKEKYQSKPRPVLLHGVTGSGKTEVYLQAIGEVLATGKTALMIVPEIALTPQAIERLRDRFLGQKIRVAVLHSHLSRGEKYDQWQQARDGRARVVIGARSAIFAPVADLGLIVVDEEHEHTYKQEDAPHYHGRDVAVLRAHLEGATILLGSATPSLESWQNGQMGKYAVATLTQRVAARPMPTVHVVDTRRSRKEDGAVLLAPPVREAIEQRIVRGEQTILYLNRRGHSTSLQCPDCGQVEVCPRCSVNVTYHRAVEKLRCHFCDYIAPAPKQCPQCASIGYRYSGVGTQKLEEAMDRELSKARLLRMDSDAMRGKRAYAEALAQFGRGEVDVLVGTQMIAKGLDFPQVTCVAVINVDGALQIPDFRASERVFQQLMQVAGRAGRGDKGGEVFIQTKTPFHPAIQYARHHDYAGFVEQELEFRQALQYPPYRRVLLLKWRGRNEEKTLFVAGEVLKQVKQKLGEFAEVGEVAPASIARIDHYFRFQSLILTTRVVECSRRLRGLVLDSEWPEGVQMGLDVDPLHLM